MYLQLSLEWTNQVNEYPQRRRRKTLVKYVFKKVDLIVSALSLHTQMHIKDFSANLLLPFLFASDKQLLQGMKLFLSSVILCLPFGVQI